MTSFYELMSVFIPVSLILWTIDYLSDSKIVVNETKLGMLQYLHHIVALIGFIGPFINLFVGNLPIYVISIILNIIVQIGWIRNNDYCWLTRLVNTTINPNQPDRKWRGEIGSFIKHYVRGDSWAYSDIYDVNYSNSVVVLNIIFIIGLLKVVYF